MGGGTEAAAGRLVMTLGIAVEAMGSTGATAGASPPRSRWRLVAEALAQRMNKSVRVELYAIAADATELMTRVKS